MSATRCANAPSAARLFVQLSTRSHHPSVLDVLLPPRTRSFRSLARCMPKSCARATLSSCVHEKSREGLAWRPFSSTTSRRRTQAIHNPQSDDDGNEMTLDITPRAANRLSQIMVKDANPHLALRIQVESGGCHGFQYLMSLLTLPSFLSASKATTSVPGNPSSPTDASVPIPPSATAEAELTPSTTADITPPEPAVREDDTVFAFVKDNVALDQDGGRTLASGPKIILDRPSLDLLKGSKVDFTMELIGSQFKIVDNPLATSSCGCGTSFDIKA